MILVKPSRLARVVLGVLLGCWGLAGLARAETHEGQRVIAVETSGEHSIAKETILAKVQMKPGAPYSDQVVSEDLRRLFATGYFTDVKADVEPLPDGLKLIFVVKEKPVVRSIDVQGNRFLRRDRLLELFAVSAGELYDPRKVKEGTDLIKAEYARKGFAQCEVAARAQIDGASNTTTLYLLIDEGPRMRITDIFVEGNTAFSDRQVRKLLKTKRKRWFLHGVYNEPVLEEDLERIRAFYRKHGYQDIAVSKELYRDPAGRGLYLRLKLAEGLQHRIGQMTLEGVVLFPEPEHRRLISLKPGAVYSDEALQEDLRLIKQYYGDRGYINADVAPEPQLDPATKRVNLTYHITENELVYVNRVAIRGNLRTRDVVVRRELRIYPGERFDGTKIRKSVDRL